MSDSIRIKNKKASFEYTFIEKFVAGIVLTGTEIKSIRESKVSIAEAYCLFVNEELFVRNMHISEYSYGTYNNHDPRRDRKLLMNRKELRKLNTKLKEQGITIVPIVLFVNEKGLAKIEIALAKGKKLYDKRESLKDKDHQREIDRREK